MSQLRQKSLAEALRTARKAGASSPSPTPGDGRSPTPGSTPQKRRIATMASQRSTPTSLRPAPSPFEFFNDPSVLVSTPVELGREEEFAENLSYAFAYSTDLVTVLKSGGFNPKTGLTLDNEEAESDFTVLLAGLGHVLFPISYAEFSKLLDLENDHEFYHITLNEILFTILPVVLRGTALALYHEAARSHPVDGRYVLQRLRYEVEGVPDPDTDRYWSKLRASVVDEDSDPAPQLTVICKLGDKHAHLNPDYSEAKRVKDLWHVLASSAKLSPFVTPLYLNIIRELRGGKVYSFSALCLRIRTVWREEHPLATRSTDSQPAEYRVKKPTFNSLSAKNADIKPVGEWTAQPGALTKRWTGAGYPCLVCFRLWNLTDTHPDTKGACPYTCREAFAQGRAPPSTAKPAGSRPPPAAAASASAAVFGAPDAAQAPAPESVVPKEPPPTGVASFMTFRFDQQASWVGPSIDDDVALHAVSQDADQFALDEPDDSMYPAFREPALTPDRAAET
ncbi:hypothetical protein CYMTET_7381 [Cymbomonas tetramitiformis]|uniref:Uncharacterized protein n=1 Tax=Cymbomonas tetramitiformis TaxID=36881 RepID=A0AAE0GVC5_9CHLO|nr:hypothetical protein CYMTET_7381 [Cymbomonas tetramitiformis]